MIGASFLNAAAAAATVTTEATTGDDNDQAVQWDGELNVVEEPQEDDIRTLEMHDTYETDSSDSDDHDDDYADAEDDAEGVSGPEYPDSEADGSDSDTDTSESDSDAENEPAVTAAPGGPLAGTPPWSVAAVRIHPAYGPRLRSWGGGGGGSGGGGGGGGGRGVWASAASEGTAAMPIAITTNEPGDGASVSTERVQPPAPAGGAPDTTDVDLQMDDAAGFLLMEHAARALGEARKMAAECGAAMEASSLRRAAAAAAAFAPGDAVAVAVDAAPDAAPAVRKTSSPSASTSTTDCGGSDRKEELVRRLQAVVGDYVAAMVPRVDAARATEAALAAQAATHREEVARLTAALRRASKTAEQESRKAAAARVMAREAREELRGVYARLAGIVPASACAAAASTAVAYRVK